MMNKVNSFQKFEAYPKTDNGDDGKIERGNCINFVGSKFS